VGGRRAAAVTSAVLEVPFADQPTTTAEVQGDPDAPRPPVYIERFTPSSGPPGRVVEFTGGSDHDDRWARHHTGGGVTFGGVAATFTLGTPVLSTGAFGSVVARVETMTAVVPADATTGPIEVTAEPPEWLGADSGVRSWTSTAGSSVSEESEEPPPSPSDPGGPPRPPKVRDDEKDPGQKGERCEEDGDPGDAGRDHAECAKAGKGRDRVRDDRGKRGESVDPGRDKGDRGGARHPKKARRR
jgi:hypothetical protein